MTDREKRILHRLARENPSWTYATLLQELPFNISRHTVIRHLKEYGLVNWRAKKRQLLTQKTADIRLAWCQSHLNWTENDWYNVIFSDECSVERGAGKGTKWIWRHTGQAFDKDKVQTRNKTKDIRVMVWGAITYNQVSDLIIMQRDMKAKRQGYTAESYIQALQFGLPSIFTEEKIFQQDNAPIHTAKKSKAFFTKEKLHLLDGWPPYSPDLNVIENLWAILKKHLYEEFPDCDAWPGTEEEIQRRMEDALVHTWSIIDKGIVNRLMWSMKQRMIDCVAADGWYTKY